MTEMLVWQSLKMKIIKSCLSYSNPILMNLVCQYLKGRKTLEQNLKNRSKLFLNQNLQSLVLFMVYHLPSILEKCRTLGIKTIGAATTVDEAIALEKAGVDAIVATGFEAGGHRVSFIRSAEESLTGIFSLIPQVADNVKIPIIAAGGIADSRGIKAALSLGADAVQMGTAFLATSQSNATQDHKDKLFSTDAKYTTLTKIFTGRLSRGIRNRLTEELKNHESLLAPYPLQGKFMSYSKGIPTYRKF